VQGDVAQPQYKQFWVATNGTSNFIGDCSPDLDTKYAVTSDTTGCCRPNLSERMSWAGKIVMVQNSLYMPVPARSAFYDKVRSLRVRSKKRAPEPRTA